MAAWVIWAIVAVGLAVGEILTPGLFFLGPVALAAVLAAAVPAGWAGGGGELIRFIAPGNPALALLRAIARPPLHNPARVRAGNAAPRGGRGGGGGRDRA